MKKLFAFFALIFWAQGIQAYEHKRLANLKASDFSDLSFNRLQSMRKAYIDFLKLADSEFYGVEVYQSALDQGESGSVVDLRRRFPFALNFLYAHAAGEELCFFGGWPSRMSGSYCQAPWKHRNDPEVAGYGPVYSPELFCGEKDLFRCNPVLFGEGEGSCVQMGATYAELTDKCEEASAGKAAELAAGIQNSPEKAQQLERFNQAIFGENGFCTTFRAKHSKDYDACDSLGKRIGALMNADSSGQLQADGSAAPAAQANHRDEGLAILKQCEGILPEDVNGRGVMQALQGGLVACGASLAEADLSPLDEGGLKEVAEEFDKLAFLKKLNLKSFEYKMRALLNMETAFMQEGPQRGLASSGREDLFQRMAAKFPGLKADEEFKRAFERVYDEHQESKARGKVGKIELAGMAANFKVLANGNPAASPPVKGVNEVCKEVYEKFQAKHGQDRDTWLKRALWFSDEEKATIEELRVELNGALNQAAHASQTGFLMGTKHFKKHVMDPTVDFAKECVEDPSYNVLNSTLTENDLRIAIGEAHQEVMNSLEDLEDKEEPFTKDYWLSSSQGRAESLIEKYLKEDKRAVADVLAQSGQGEQASAAQFLCLKTKELYTKDKRMVVVSWLGVGASLVGGAACIFPLTAPVGCPVMAAGTAVSTIAGGARAYEGMQLGTAASLNQIQAQGDASDFASDSKAANDQFVSGATEVALSKGGIVISGVAKLRKAYVAGRGGRAIARSGDAGADHVQWARREADRLLEAPAKGTAMQPAGSTRIKFTDPDTGREYIRFVDSRVLAMGNLDDATRARAIEELFGPSLSNLDEVRAGQIEAIMEAHKKFPCAIGKCSAKQLRDKLAWMKRKGVPDDVASDSIRFGITGYSDEALAARTWANGLQDLGAHGKGPFILSIERKTPDGATSVEEVFAHYRGSDAKGIHLENIKGRFTLDPNDPAVSVKRISVERGSITHDGAHHGFFTRHDQALFETDPSRALSAATGKQVKITRVVDGEEIESAGEIVIKDGLPHLKYQRQAVSADKYYYALLDPEDVAQVRLVYKPAQWSPKGQQAHTSFLEEAFQSEAPVVLKYRQSNYLGAQEARVMEGRYAGWVDDNGAKKLVVRDSDGSLKYFDFKQVDELSSPGGEATVFNGGVLP